MRELVTTWTMLVLLSCIRYSNEKYLFDKWSECSLILLLLCYVYCLHICQLCLAKLTTVYYAVVIFAGLKRAQTTQTCCGAEFWLMFTNFFWSTDTDIMHPALSDMSCSIVERVDWVNNVIEILGPSLIRYCLCSEECHLLVMYDEEVTTKGHRLPCQ